MGFRGVPQEDVKRARLERRLLTDSECLADDRIVCAKPREKERAAARGVIDVHRVLVPPRKEQRVLVVLVEDRVAVGTVVHWKPVVVQLNAGIRVDAVQHELHGHLRARDAYSVPVASFVGNVAPLDNFGRHVARRKRPAQVDDCVRAVGQISHLSPPPLPLPLPTHRGGCRRRRTVHRAVVGGDVGRPRGGGRGRRAALCGAVAQGHREHVGRRARERVVRRDGEVVPEKHGEVVHVYLQPTRPLAWCSEVSSSRDTVDMFDSDSESDSE